MDLPEITNLVSGPIRNKNLVSGPTRDNKPGQWTYQKQESDQWAYQKYTILSSLFLMFEVACIIGNVDFKKSQDFL